VTGGGELHNEEPHDLHSLPYKSERLAWNIAHMGDKTDTYKILVGILTEQDHLLDLRVNGRIRYRQNGTIRLAQWWVLLNTVMNLGVQLSNYQLPIKDSVQWM
jgi:hypothetical protein